MNLRMATLVGMVGASLLAGCGLVNMQTDTTGLSGLAGSPPEAPGAPDPISTTQAKPKAEPTTEMPKMLKPVDPTELAALGDAIERADETMTVQRVAHADKLDWDIHREAGQVIARTKNVWAFYEVTEERLKMKQQPGECYYQYGRVGQDHLGSDKWTDMTFFNWIGAPVLVTCDASADQKHAAYFGGK